MLTTDDLTSTTFTTTRREGYEIGEVDEFVTNTIETLRHRDATICELQERVAGCTCSAESSRAAARLLELAARNADELLTEAMADAAAVRAEAEEHRTTVLSALAERQAGLEAEITRLEQLESDHRAAMRTYFTDQLQHLEPTPAG